MRTEQNNQMRIMTERDYRNHQWKIKRQRKVRTYIIGMVLTALLMVGLIFFFRVLTTNAQSQETLAFKYYTSIQVSYGETLWSIAEEYQDNRFYNSIQDYIAEVIQINHLKNADDLMAGQYLVIPYYLNEFIK